MATDAGGDCWRQRLVTQASSVVRCSASCQASSSPSHVTVRVRERGEDGWWCLSFALHHQIRCVVQQTPFK